MSVGKQIDLYMQENGIEKKSISSKMGISEAKLERILNTPDNIMNCLTYRNLVMALGVSADYFEINI